MLRSNSPMFPIVLLRLPDVLVLKSLCVLRNPTGDTNFQNTNEPLLPLMGTDTCGHRVCENIRSSQIGADRF